MSLSICPKIMHFNKEYINYFCFLFFFFSFVLGKVKLTNTFYMLFHPYVLKSVFVVIVFINQFTDFQKNSLDCIDRFESELSILVVEVYTLHSILVHSFSHSIFLSLKLFQTKNVLRQGEREGVKIIALPCISIGCFCCTTIDACFIFHDLLVN